MGRVRITGLVVAMLLLVPATAGAQSAADLERAESLVAAGQYDEARAILAALEKVDAAPALRARSLLLRARLAPDPFAAEKDYLAVVLGHPGTPEAAAALLALGQGLLAAGDIDRAISYLQRLDTDYPGSAEHPIGLLWLARAHRADGDLAQACRAARAGTRVVAADAELSALLALEESATCKPAEAAPPEPTPAPAPTPSGAYAVQSGAFRQRQGAEALAARLRRAGHEPRLVYVAGSQLLRVRVRRFQNAKAADALAQSLRKAGFAAIVVNDVARERTEP